MWTFRAMSTDVLVAAPSLDDRAERELALAIEAMFRDTERRFSRFRPDSELSRLNRAIEPIEVSPELLALLVRGRAHAGRTGGLFEPAVGAALCASGYDRSFAEGALDDDAPPGTAPGARGEPRATIAAIEIDEEHRRVRRPAHVQLDLGGFLKGLTVDRAAALTTAPVVVDAGGDAVLRGAPRGEGGWTVEVEDPSEPSRTIATLDVRDAAVATSAPNRRAWRRGARRMHHLIDPREGAPARGDLAQVTVLAPTAEEADVFAKVAFVLGARAGAARLEREGLRGVLVARDGAVVTVGDLELADA